MKSTEYFKMVIQNHLNGLAANDELFAETLKKPNKNINDCITYILNQVKTSGCNGFADEEIYQMAIHYYDEDDIKPGDKIKSKVIINQSIELSETDIKRAKQFAIDKVIQEEKEKLQKKKKTKKEVSEINEQQTLF